MPDGVGAPSQRAPRPSGTTVPAPVDRLDDLRLFVDIARLGSISRAAAAAGISQPALSRRMRSLERALRLPLLQRSKQGSVVTPAGLLVVDWAATLLTAASEFEKSLELLRGRDVTALRVAVSMTVAEHYIPHWMNRLRQRLPSAPISLTVCNSTEVTERVVSGEADLGFIESPSASPGVSQRAVGRDELVLVVGPAHPWARRRKGVGPTEVAHAGVLVREPGSGTRRTLEQALQAVDLRLEPGLELPSNTALKEAAAASMGAAVLSRMGVSQDLATGRLREVPTVGLELARPLTAIWRRGSDLAPLARDLVAAASTPLVDASGQPLP